MDAKYGTRLKVTKIPKDEPLFLLRAQDKLAATAIHFYRDMLIAAGLDEMANDVTHQVTRFVEWGVLHPDRVKLPD